MQRSSSTLVRELARILGDARSLDPAERPDLLGDAAVELSRDRRSAIGADAIALPTCVEEVSAVMRWCHDHDVVVTPRGGGSGLSGGAVASDGVILALERCASVRSLEPGLWRMEVEAGITTAHVRRLARENGLYFPPDPGAAEQSQIGGNVATNAGGPHAFKYGVTGRWVTGLEAVLGDGEVISIGGTVRKDVAGYALRDLLVGSEGTLAVITSVALRLIPAPEAARPLAAFFNDLDAGCEAITGLLATGVPVAAIEAVDGGTLASAGAAFPLGPVPEGAGFLLITEVDGSPAEVEAGLREVREAFSPDALGMCAPSTARDIEALWRWRDGVSLAVAARRGAKVSEDIAVPVDRLADAMHETVAIGERHGIEGVSFGHAGDGNLHSTFLFAPDSETERAAAERCCVELFRFAASIGGSISGEHGLGTLKSGHLDLQWSPRACELHTGIKRLFDPRNLLNPKKKLAAPDARCAS